MAEINFEKMAHNVAEAALDSFKYYGKTIREWMKIIVEQEPCDNAISREDAMSAIRMAFSKVVPSNPSREVREIFNLCRENLEQLPPVISQQKYGEWTPVSEVLPEESEK